VNYSLLFYTLETILFNFLSIYNINQHNLYSDLRQNKKNSKEILDLPKIFIQEIKFIYFIVIGLKDDSKFVGVILLFE
jgi:hypothetical protein